MKSHSIDTLTQEAHDAIGTATDRPLIGITTDCQDMDYTVRQAYASQVVRAGGVPVLIPPITDAHVINATLHAIDALLLTGGGDHNPLWYGEEPVSELGTVNPVRDRAELLLTRLAADLRLPMLGICRGMQTMAIALGGHVEQHHASGLKHSQDAPRPEATHTVTLLPHSTLHNIYACEAMAVNSFHHQVVDDAGPMMEPVAWAPDTAMEAMQGREHKEWLAVQWHPEWLADDGLPIFQWLVQRAADYRQERKIEELKN